MICDVQKASIWKRASAFLLDAIILVILATGLAYLVSVITHYDKYDDRLQGYYDEIEAKYGFDLEMSAEEYEKLSPEDQQKCNDMFKELNENEDAVYCYNVTVRLAILMVSLGTLLGITLSEFVVPLILKNGQTIGKKCFQIGVVKINSVRITTLQLFVRTFLGKYTIEIMVPLLVIVLLIFNQLGLIGPILLLVLLIFQIGLLIFTKYKTPIHDIFAYTAVVDMQTQMVFDSDEQLLEYKKKNHLDDVRDNKEV